MSDRLSQWPELARWLELATRAAQSAGPLVMSGFRSPSLTVERKPDDSYVTDFDRRAEQQIRAVLGSEPDNPWPVVGEELGGDVGGADFYWIIDPIDGTTAFTRGLPHFGTLLALDDAKAQRAVVGVINVPACGETYTAARGMGAFCNGTPIKVSGPRDWRDRLLSVPPDESFRRAGFAEGYARLCRQGAHLRGNADCWMHAMVARGCADALVEFGLRRWDVAATEVLIEEAGGLCVLRPSKNGAEKFDLLIGSPAAVAEIAALLGF
jgi:fructose-1,6-bisphosphatase/inositol monophosphatase family enzyme